MSIILGTTDVALLLRCSTERVRQLAREGRLPAERLPGGQRIFRFDDVERLLVEREQQRQKKAGACVAEMN
jgi:excisionase family DNA binding protein